MKIHISSPNTCTSPKPDSSNVGFPGHIVDCGEENLLFAVPEKKDLRGRKPALITCCALRLYRKDAHMAKGWLHNKKALHLAVVKLLQGS